MSNRLPSKPSVTIVGGGIIGLMTALHLRKFLPGSTITVLERAKYIPNPGGSSSRSAACTRQQFGCQHSVEMSMYSTRFYENFARHTGEIGRMLWQVGYLFLHRDQARWADAQARVLNQQRWGLKEVRPLSPDEAIRDFPFISADGLLGATFCPTDGYLDPGIILQALKARLLARGVQIVTGIEVNSFDASGDRITGVHSNLAYYRCDAVINCAGAWSERIGRLLGSRLDVSPEKRYLWSACTDRDHDFPQEQFERLPMIVCCGNNGLTPYVRPEPGRDPHNFVIGCEHDISAERDFVDGDQDRVDPRYHPTGECFEPILQTLAGFAPFVGQLGFREKVNAGYYETTPSHNPYLTFDPRWQNVIHACGFSGHGMMHAPAAGLTVAELLANDRYPDEFYNVEQSVGYQAHVDGTGATELMKI